MKDLEKNYTYNTINTLFTWHPQKKKNPYKNDKIYLQMLTSWKGMKSWKKGLLLFTYVQGMTGWCFEEISDGLKDVYRNDGISEKKKNFFRKKFFFSK